MFFSFLIKRVKDKWENGDLGAQKAFANFLTVWVIRTTDLKGNSGKVNSFECHRGTEKGTSYSRREWIHAF